MSWNSIFWLNCLYILCLKCWLKSMNDPISAQWLIGWARYMSFKFRPDFPSCILCEMAGKIYFEWQHIIWKDDWQAVCLILLKLIYFWLSSHKWKLQKEFQWLDDLHQNHKSRRITSHLCRHAIISTTTSAFLYMLLWWYNNTVWHLKVYHSAINSTI